MSGQGSGSGGQRRSDRLAKGKAVAYAPESSPDIDDEYDAMEDVRTRADSTIARNLQAELDAEAAGLASGATRPPSRPGVVIGRSARPSGTPRRPTTTPAAVPPTRSKRYPPRGGIRPRHPVTTPVEDTPLLTGLIDHPSSPGSSRECGPGRMVRLLSAPGDCSSGVQRFFGGVGLWPLPQHPLCTCVASPGEVLGGEAFALGVGFPLASLYLILRPWRFWALMTRTAIVGKNLPSLKVSYLRDLLRREIEEPPTELRYRQWVAYFIFSCFLGNDKSTIPTPIVGMFRDVDALRDYDWGALTYGFYIRGLRRFSRRETISFLWLLAAKGLSLDSGLTSRTLLECRTTVDCMRDADIVFQPYSPFLVERPEMGGEVVVPVDPLQLMTIEGYIPRAPSDSYVEGVDAYPGPDSGFRVRSCVSSLSCQSARTAIRPRWIDLQGKIARMQMEETQRQGRDDPDAGGHWSSGRGTWTLGISSGHGQTSSPPPPDPVSRDWFFDDPPSL
uniref:Aminotransferase-like plant mobile domain-containing protein n=1 Tax=Fagus sylvatica TaxID=28930 RepID=A0A2N9IZM0_FAGSY